MFTVTKFPHGTFSWADVGTYDTEKGKTFYMSLFGWSKEEMPMGEGMTYTMFKLDGENVAALSPMMPDAAEQGIPPAWTNYITVDDLDTVEGLIKENGGTIVHGPMDVFDSGRMLILQDPTGAHVALWQPKNHIGASVVNKPGAMLWNELSTRDVEKAKDFFNKVLGWEYKTDENNYTMILNKGRMNGGMMQMDDSWGDVPPAWMTYFNIENLDKAIEKVPTIGGKVMMGKTSAGEVGEFAMIADPTGAVFTIMQANAPEPWKE